jgi:hypothetical protein
MSIHGVAIGDVAISMSIRRSLLYQTSLSSRGASRHALNGGVRRGGGIIGVIISELGFAAPTEFSHARSLDEATMLRFPIHAT